LLGQAARKATQRPATRPASPRAFRRWPGLLLVAVLAAASYANSLDGELFLDDRPAILENQWVLAGDPIAIFTHGSWWGTHTKISTWRPLTTASFALSYALHGAEPRGWHLVNVALHGAVSVVLALVLARLVPPITALAAALLFAVHPVHTEVVASAVGRAELLSALGFFAAWWCLLAADAARDGAPPRPGTGLTVLGAALFLAAMLAKENAITLLPVLVCADLVSAPKGEVGARLRRRVPRYVGLAIVAVLFVVVRVRLSGELTPAIPTLDNPLVTLSAPSRIMTAIAVVAYYALRLAFPLWLSADYTAWQIPPVTTPFDPRFLCGLVVVLAVPAAFAWSRTRDRPLALGLGLMTIPFLLIANLLFLIATIMAERWLYLPSAGFCLVAAALLARVTGAAAATRDAWKRIAVPLAVLVVLLGIRTWVRNPVWRSPMAFFSRLVETAPDSSLAHTGYGDALAADGRYAAAFAEYERALTIAPINWRAEYNRGNARLATGDVAGAIAGYERTLELQPEYAKAMINLGAAESRRGNGPAAIAWLRRALTLEPAAPTVHTSLANVLAANGDRAGADAEFRAALGLAPQSADALADYGAFLISNGASADAVSVLRRSLALQPNVAERHYNLGTALALSGALEEAVAAYRQALSLRPGFTAAMENLGNTESLRGNHAAALEWLRRAETAGADSPQLHTNIGNELSRLGRTDEAQREYDKAR
jgi:Flp pilus assembly protein TadD